MVILVKKFLTKFTKIWNFIPNTVFGDRPNKTKNRYLDKWRGKIRMPFESTFSKLNKRAKFRGKVKVLFQCFAESIAYNLKKAIRILPDSIGV